MVFGEGLNRAAEVAFEAAKNNAEDLRIKPSELDCGTQILDFGCEVEGGLAAGVAMASVCMSGLAKIDITHGPSEIWPGMWVQVTTDHPLSACMLSQYAGWPVKYDLPPNNFFAMGSGAMRLLRGKEELLIELNASDSRHVAVGTLECDGLPADAIATAMAAECGIPSNRLQLAIAPTRSVAGCVQVVARSIETCLHKMHELKFDLSCIHSAFGIAPLPPPTPDFADGIGRTNDAILYGARVSLIVDLDDDQIAQMGDRIPSCASTDFGQPFAAIFKSCNFDFYKIDPGLFSPAEVLISNVRTGRSWSFGKQRHDLIARSFNK